MKSKTAKGKKSLASSSRPSPSKSAQSKSSSVKCAKGQISKIPSHARWSKITKVTAKRKRIVKSNCGKGKKTPSAPVSSSVTSQAHTVRSKDLEKERENASAKQADGIRKQVFILLHRPSGFEYFYHLFVVLLIITSCCVLNILKPKNPWDDIYIYNHYRTIHMAMCGVDSFLTGRKGPFLCFKSTTYLNCYSVPIRRNADAVLGCGTQCSVLWAPRQVAVRHRPSVPGNGPLRLPHLLRLRHLQLCHPH